MSEEKKLRYFGDGDNFGDGCVCKVYLGDTKESVLEQMAIALDNSAEDDGELYSSIVISTDMMTDAEVEALPDL